jgi:O-antigen/teichoic acid export membrane protein
MHLPSVYIQILHYNNAHFLKECIDSVCQLDYTNFSSIIVNDCSSDDTKEVLNTIHLPENIHVIHNAKRLGRVENYQFAFSQRKQAEWLINLDSDDYYTCHRWLDEAMQIVHSNPSDNITHIQSNFLARIGINHIHILKDYGNGYYLISGIDYIRLCIKHYGFSHLSSIFKIDLVEKHGAYSDDCLHTDFLTAARAALLGNVIIGSKEIGVWRKHDGNQSSQRYSHEEYAKNQVSYYRLFEWCEDYLSYKEIKNLINIFENREQDRKLMSTIQTRDFRSLRSFIQQEKLSFWSLIQSVSRVFLSDFGSEKLSNISHGIFTRGLSVLITLLSLPFILQYLGIDEYSWIGIYTTIASALYIFDFGLTNIITKEISQIGFQSRDRLKTVIATQEIMYLSIGVFISAALILSSDWLLSHWLFGNSAVGNTKNILWLIAIAILVQWPHSFYTGALFGLNKQTVSNYTQLGLTAVKNVGILFLFTLFTASIELFFYWHICISLVTILIQKILIYKEVRFVNSFQYFSLSYINQLKRLAIGISIISLFGFIYSDMNNFLLTRWLSKSEFGYYAILYNILMAFIMYCATVKSALFPYISKAVHSEHLDAIQTNYTKHFQIISYSLIPLCVLLIIVRDDFLITWLQENNTAQKLSTSFSYIIIGSLCNALMIIPWTYLIAMSKTRFLIYLTGFLALISIPLLYTLINLRLFEGASLYWLIINLIPLPFLIYHVNSLHKINNQNQIIHSIIIPLIISVVIFLSAKVVSDSMNLNALSSIFLAIFSLVSTYILLFFLKYFKLKHNF